MCRQERRGGLQAKFKALKLDERLNGLRQVKAQAEKNPLALMFFDDLGAISLVIASNPLKGRGVRRHFLKIRHIYRKIWRFPCFQCRIVDKL